MICSNCGFEIPPDLGTCPNCGTWAVEPFDSAVFKARAKAALKNRYWLAFAVSLIEFILISGLDVVNRINNYFGDPAVPNYYPPSLLMALLSIFSAFFLFTIVYSIFISSPILVGSSKYFIKAHDGSGDISDIFYSFKGRHYIKIVGAMAWQNLFIFLWSLLLFIPGIVKSYAYFLVPYILAENPHIGFRRALKLSMEITNGYKGDIFVLQLSFIGWFLLGMLCLGVGVLFVQPYYNATLAEMYLSLKTGAIRRGICTADDFPGMNETGMQAL